MISVFENYKLVNDLLSKNNSATISFEEYDRYANLAQNDLFDVLRGSENLPKSVYGKSRKLDERLNEFRVKQAIVFTGGLATKPANSAQITSIITGGNEPVHPIDEDRTAMIIQDPLSDDFYYSETNTQLKLEKGTDFTGTIQFLKRPTNVKTAYTITSGRAVYNSTGTVDFEWQANLQMELTTRILSYAGLSIGAQLPIQFSQAKQNIE